MFKISNFRTIFALAALSLAVAGCGAVGEKSAEDKDTEATMKLQADANAKIGMPRVTNFTEKRIANMIVELRDKPNLATYTYVMQPGLGYCFLGKTIGFGLPYTTQITNPQRDLWGNQGASLTLPQAEPNGLYSSDSTSATWILRVGKDGEVKPDYIESDIHVSLMPLANNHPC